MPRPPTGTRLKVWQRDAAPADWALTQHSLGNLCLSRYDRSILATYLQEAVSCWQRALVCLHDAMRAAIDVGGPAGEAATIPHRLVTAHLTVNDPAATLAAAEAGRGVRRRLDLARSGRVPAGLTPDEEEE